MTGEGPDLVVAPGFISHLDIMWEEPSVVHFYSRLASFRRVVTFDKRGTGLSDPVMLREGKIHPVVADRLPLSDARHAHELLDRTAATGKLVLVS